MREQLSGPLLALLGEQAFVALTQSFGGTRLYIPLVICEDHEIAKTIGVEAARKLSRRHAPDTIRVPLARAQRARHYRAQGLSNAQIARMLGVGETGVDKIIKRHALPPKGTTGQLSLFED